MPFSVELSEEETECLQRYFERVDETEDFSFRHPAEPLAFRSLVGQLSTVARRRDACEPIATRPRIVPGAIRHGDECLASSTPSADGQTPSSVGSVRTRESRAIVHDCMRALERFDRAALEVLFVRDAHVVTPVRGRRTVADFLNDIDLGRGGTRLTCHDIRRNLEGRLQALGYFIHEPWRGRANEGGVFNCVLNISASSDGVQSMLIF